MCIQRHRSVRCLILRTHRFLHRCTQFFKRSERPSEVSPPFPSITPLSPTRPCCSPASKISALCREALDSGSLLTHRLFLQELERSGDEGARRKATWLRFCRGAREKGVNSSPSLSFIHSLSIKMAQSEFCLF